MKHKIWAAGAALTVAALALPYGAATNAAAEDDPAMTAQVTKATSSSRQTSSEVAVAGTWATPKLAVGQSFTVSTQPTNGGAPFTWAASFPFMLDDGSVVGECAADQATLTCTVTEVPAAYKDKADVKGTWWARARLQDAAVGTNEGTITVELNQVDAAMAAVLLAENAGQLALKALLADRTAEAAGTTNKDTRALAGAAAKAADEVVTATEEGK